MCGLVGRIQLNSEIEHPPIQSALQWLDRRGPDSNGTWSTPDKGVELLHTRLHTTDPSPNARQPMVSDKEDVVVAFNGDIYNHMDLRSTYKDYTYRTKSDTEIILAAYDAEGISGFKKFRGTFSFAIVDNRTKQVILVRDPVGKKPFYLAQLDNQVAFGSSILSMASIIGSPLTINQDAAIDYWDLQFALPHRTVLNNIRPLIPGEVTILDFQGNIIETTDCKPTSPVPDPAPSLEDVHKNVDTLLCQAITRRLGGIYTPTIVLSGGLDSTVLSHIMAARKLLSAVGKDDKLLAVSLGSVIPYTNDEPYARFAASRLGIDLIVHRPHFHDLAKETEAAFDMQDEPLGMPSHLQLASLLRHQKEHSRVAISGDGGDEIFLGYNETDRWVGPDHPPYPDRLGANQNVVSGPDLPEWMSPWGQYMAGNGLVGHGFAKVDRAASEQAVVLRAPFLDWDLMSYVRSLPPGTVLHDDQTKALLHDMLSSWPKKFTRRRKRGFSYNLRWVWAITRFHGLRDMVSQDAIAQFEHQLPTTLRRPSHTWSTFEIHKHFVSAWKLAAWSAFLKRLSSTSQRIG